MAPRRGRHARRRAAARRPLGGAMRRAGPARPCRRVVERPGTTPATSEERGGDREPAAARDGDGVDPARLGLVDDLVAHDDPADERRQRPARAAPRATNATTIGPIALPAVAMKVIRVVARSIAGRRRRRHAAGSPGTGKRLDDLADLAGEAVLRGRLVAAPDRLDDDPADRRASRPAPKPRDVVAGVPTRMPGRGVGRQRVERDRVLVDRDADLVEEVLGLLAGHARAASRRRA